MRKALARLGAYLFRPYYSLVDCAALLAVAWFFTFTGHTWFVWCLFLIWRVLVIEIETRIALRRTRRFRRP